MRIGNWFKTCVSPMGPSSGNTYIQITKKIYWDMSGLYVYEISFLQLIGLYRRVIGVCIDVVYYSLCVSWMREFFFSNQSVDFDRCN